MNYQQDKRLGVLKIERAFDAPVEDVFDAFTKPELMNQWFHGFPQGCSRVEADLRVGGKYRIEMVPHSPTETKAQSGCGASYLHHGEYLEISPPDRLVFTWIKDGFVDYSVVALDFKRSGSSTLLTLTHHVPTELIPPHTQGWNACIDNLEKFLI